MMCRWVNSWLGETPKDPDKACESAYQNLVAHLRWREPYGVDTILVEDFEDMQAANIAEWLAPTKSTPLPGFLLHLANIDHARIPPDRVVRYTVSSGVRGRARTSLWEHVAAASRLLWRALAHSPPTPLHFTPRHAKPCVSLLCWGGEAPSRRRVVSANACAFGTTGV